MIQFVAEYYYSWQKENSAETITCSLLDEERKRMDFDRHISCDPLPAKVFVVQEAESLREFFSTPLPRSRRLRLPERIGGGGTGGRCGYILALEFETDGKYAF